MFLFSRSSIIFGKCPFETSPRRKFTAVYGDVFFVSAYGFLFYDDLCAVKYGSHLFVNSLLTLFPCVFALYMVIGSLVARMTHVGRSLFMVVP